MTAGRDDEGGSVYLREVMAETSTYWSDDAPPPRPADGPITVWTPVGARQTVPKPSEASWVIPAVVLVLALGIIAVIVAVVW